MSKLRLALFGSPISHSPSPAIHGSFATQLGIDVDYRLIEASPAVFPEKLDRFRWGGGKGCNITLPLKHQASRMADARTERVEVATAANTLWWDEKGQLHADNTDGRGLVRDLVSNLEIEIAGKKLLILGAGGAAAGILGALLACKPATLTVFNRTLERAQALATQHSRLGKVGYVTAAALEHEGTYDLVIDATATGIQGQTPAIPAGLLADSGACYSLSYGKASQPLGKWCEKLGTSFYSGWGMLVEQAALSFEIWTGKAPETSEVLENLRHLSD
ncbi:MAG TPA: shikimate dehydrogenase [Xanthomonadales bacterium]|nr:shikimate dehydrogenase [Xanthomonadales bacterium]